MSHFSLGNPNRLLVGSLLAMSCLLSVPASAQSADTVRAPDRNLKFSLPVGLVVDESFLVNNGASAPGPRSTKETREAACGANRCYLIVMVGITPRGNMIDSVWADRNTLELVRHVESGFGNHTEVNVTSGRIAGTAKDSTGKPVRQIDAAGPTYDFSILEEIVSALPLRAGYHSVVHAFDVTQGYRDAGVSVTGAEVIETPRGKRDAWVVEFAFGTHKATRWIDKATKAGLKWRVDMGNGRSMWGQATER